MLTTISNDLQGMVNHNARADVDVFDEDEDGQRERQLEEELLLLRNRKQGSPAFSSPSAWISLSNRGSSVFRSDSSSVGSRGAEQV
jgi:hypothetical protein